jgi:hypothetical protein
MKECFDYCPIFGLRFTPRKITHDRPQISVDEAARRIAKTIREDSRALRKYFKVHAQGHKL